MSTAGLKYISSAINAGAGTAVTKLDSNLLVGEQEQAVHDFVVRYYRRYQEVPGADIVRENTGVNLPRTSGTVSYHLDELEERAKFNVIRARWSDLREAIGQGQAGGAIQIMEDVVRATRRRADNTVIDAHQGMQLVIDRLRGIRALGGISGIPTPWPTLNDVSGGYQKADLITYVGRSGMGKTNMLLAQAEAAYAEGYSVLMVTTEMGAEQIVRRWMAQRFSLDPQALKLGQVSNYLLRRMEDYQRELEGRERFRLLSAGMQSNVGTIFNAVEETLPDIVMLDGVYLLRPTADRRLNRTESITEVVNEIKQGTIDTNLPWVISTQFNRQAGKKGVEGDLENIGLTDAIGWNSSMVIAVKPGPTENPELSRELDILKGREGERAQIPINYKFKPVDFSELSADEINSFEADYERLMQGGGDAI